MKKIVKTNKVAEPLYKLYSIDKYNGKTQHFINNKYTEYSLNELAIELQNNKGYHMRICDNKNYIFFGDCDGYNGKFIDFAVLLKKFLDIRYNIDVVLDEISYTENESKSKYGSFHYSIPKIYGSCAKLKEMHEMFYKEHQNIFSKNTDGKIVRIIDTSIYTNKWFRYPNQSKEGNNNVKHIIINGDIVDFIVEYIPSYSICIDNNNYIEKKVTISNAKAITKTNANKTNTNKTNTNKENNLITRMPNLFINNRTMNKNKNKIFNDNNVLCDNKNYDVENCDNTDDNTIDTDYDTDTDTEIDYDTDTDIDTDNESKSISLFKDNIASSYKEEFLRDILSGIHVYDDINDWTRVGMALKNESQDNIEFFELWNNWSKQSKNKYDGTQVCKKKWDSFKKMNGYSIHYLLNLLKVNNPVKFEHIQKKVTIQKVLKDNKWQFPKNDCIINKIDSNDQIHKLIFSDHYCPIHNDEHIKSNNTSVCHRFFEISDKGTACMKCTNIDCIDQICPKGGIAVPKNIIKKLFINNNNINVINHNYGNNNYGNNKNIYDIRIALNGAKIYDDDVLNTFMIKSLFDNIDAIANAITHLYKEKICFVDNIWYSFNGVLWNECDIFNDIILEFLTLYDEIKNFITISPEIYGVEKRSHFDQLHNFINDVKNIKNSKGIIRKLSQKLNRKNSFDQNMNIIAFNNGVYDFDKMEFRKATSNDMIKTLCGYDYCPDYVNKSSLINMLSSLFLNKEIMEYFLTYIACSISGLNNFNVLLLLQSFVSYNKKALLELFALTFGDHFYRMKNISSIASLNEKSVLFKRLKNVRLLITDSINNSPCDSLSQLIHGKSIEYGDKIGFGIGFFNINFTTICMCDNDPVINNDFNDIVKNKIIVVKGVYSKYETENEINDLNIKKNDFFLLLLEYLQKHKNLSIIINKRNLEKCMMNKSERICCDFNDECIEKSHNSRVKCVDVYKKYIEWSNNKNLDKRLSKLELFTQLMKHHVYKKSVRIGDGPSTTGFIGIRLK